jgi:hypothetical protein
MLQTALTNFRTLSFAFVTVVMLMVGISLAPQPVQAQEASVEQRAVMLEQINMLMELIADLQEQILIKERKQYENTRQDSTNIISATSYVVATDRVTVYSTPDGQRSLGRHSKDDGGNVVSGPRLIDGKVWWKVEFKNHAGWVKEDFIERIPSISINSDENGDGVKERVAQILGDYKADRVMLIPTSQNTARPIYIEEGMDMIGSHDTKYVSGQGNRKVDGPPAVIQFDLYDSSTPFTKKENAAVPIVWQAQNVPANTKALVEVYLIEALSADDIPNAGGAWQEDVLVGTSVSRYFWDIEGDKTIGAGDYRSQITLLTCTSITKCKTLAKSSQRYFSIRN